MVGKSSQSKIHHGFKNFKFISCSRISNSILTDLSNAIEHRRSSFFVIYLLLKSLQMLKRSVIFRFIINDWIYDSGWRQYESTIWQWTDCNSHGYRAGQIFSSNSSCSNFTEVIFFSVDRLSIVNLLIRNGVDTNILNADGSTPLAIAAKKGRYLILKHTIYQKRLIFIRVLEKSLALKWVFNW